MKLWVCLFDCEYNIYQKGKWLFYIQLLKELQNASSYVLFSPICSDRTKPSILGLCVETELATECEVEKFITVTFP